MKTTTACYILLLMISYQVSSPESHFYLLHNGTDTESCGHDAATACRTLPWLLRVFFNQSEGTNTVLQRLRLTSDISMDVGPHIMDLYSWVSGLDLTLTKWKEQENPVTLTASFISLYGVDWQIRNVNVYIDSCNLTNFNLSFENSLDDFDGENANITIINSLYTVDPNNTQLTPFMRITKGNFFVLNTNISRIFSNESDGIIYVTTNSHLHLINSTISKNTVLRTVIMVTNNSSLHAENCLIEENNSTSYSTIVLSNSDGKFINCVQRNNSGKFGGVFSITNFHESNRDFLGKNNKVDIANINENEKRKSFYGVLISEGIFINNYAYFGGCIHLYFDAHIDILRTTFTNNVAHNGGVMYSTENNVITIRNSTLNRNTAIANSGCINMDTNSVVNIYGTRFEGNNARNEAGVMFAEINSSIFISDSIFVANRAVSATGVMEVNNKGNVTIVRCIFQSNSATTESSVIVIYDDITLVLLNSSFISNSAVSKGCILVTESTAKIGNIFFQGNSATKGSCVLASQGSKLALSNSTFVANNGGNVLSCQSGSHLLLQDSDFVNHSAPSDPMVDSLKSNLTIRSCSFMNNQMGIKGGIMHTASNSFTLVESCHFENNSARYGAVFFVSRKSTLFVENSQFKYNKAVSGGILYTEDSSVRINCTHFINNTGKTSGGAIESQRSNIQIQWSNFMDHTSTLGGVLYMNDSSNLMAYHALFENSSGHLGGVIYNAHRGNVVIDSCYLTRNTGVFGGAIYYLESKNLRLSNTTCTYVPTTEGKRGCIDFDLYTHTYPVDFYTLNFDIDDGINHVASAEPNFLNKSLNNKMIYKPGATLRWQETPYASAMSVPCGNQCRCHYSFSLDYNIYNCSSTNSTMLPKDDHVTQITDYMDFSSNKIIRICDKKPYLRNIYGLDLSHNMISHICEDTFTYLKNATITYLNLAKNNMSTLSSKVSNITSLQSVQLSGNNFICNCEMTWMINWFGKRTLTGKRIVEDYDHIVCHSGMMIGKHIYNLTSYEMGCYPHVLSLGEKVTIGILGALIIGIVIAIIAISRRWNEVKWLLYLHFNILDKNDEDEDLNDIEYDAFLSYSSDDSEFIHELFMKEGSSDLFLEENFGFKLALHERDFTPGVTIQSNIVHTITRSRKMFTVLSRNFVTSGWCMEEFQLAHFQMVQGKKKFLIPILKERLDIDALPEELRMYLRTHTYIDATNHANNLARLRKKLRFAMPGRSLSEIRRMNNELLNNQNDEMIDDPDNADDQEDDVANLI